MGNYAKPYLYKHHLQRVSKLKYTPVFDAQRDEDTKRITERAKKKEKRKTKQKSSSCGSRCGSSPPLECRVDEWKNGSCG